MRTKSKEKWTLKTEKQCQLQKFSRDHISNTQKQAISRSDVSYKEPLQECDTCMIATESLKKKYF